ncbi:MAG: asparagine synthase (glutamine-hydrolyzing) [Candidatus Omnitrophica bacterium]|nr:asparagine synthase (glutamine-hydrolyzing) [Candidatus Omnitrophota bacterium]
MCGIAGIHIRNGSVTPREISACRAMLEILQSRGPDAEGFYNAHEFILGHRRLSIIDLSESANQPISNEDGTIWVASNGEIYNFGQLRHELQGKGHRFKSQTDSEVIVHLYEEEGIGCLEHLKGMFAFALWDEPKRQLFLARDRLGIKPLYYAEQNSFFVFASEARAIVGSQLVPNRQDRNALAQFLLLGSIPEPSSGFESVRMLPAGHYLLRNSQGTSLHSYWSLKELFEEEGMNGPSWQELLQEAVRQQLTSDVPVGIPLSGGLDSSTLVALASRVKPGSFHTLTVGFQERDHDESEFANIASRKFHTVHHECPVSGREIREQISPFIKAMDQPTVDGLNTYVMTRLASQLGLRVLLSGLGGDEAFGGYSHFRHAKLLFQWMFFLNHVPDSMRPFFVDSGAKVFGLFGSTGLRRLVGLKKPAMGAIYQTYRGLFPSTIVRELLAEECDDLSVSFPEGETDGFKTDLERMIYLEYRHYLRDQLLRDTDVMSMSHSIEVRVPFLDEQFLASIFSAHAKHRFHSYGNKAWLKEILADDLPISLVNRPKQGFILPMETWLRRDLKSETEEVLLDGEVSGNSPFLKRAIVEEIWTKFLERKIHWSLPWSLYVLKRWQYCNGEIWRKAPVASV